MRNALSKPGILIALFKVSFDLLLVDDLSPSVLIGHCHLGGFRRC